MFIAHAILFERDDDENPDTDSVSEEAVVFYSDKSRADQCMESAEGELSEDADEKHVYDLTTEAGRKDAIQNLSLWEVFKFES